MRRRLFPAGGLTRRQLFPAGGLAKRHLFPAGGLTRRRLFPADGLAKRRLFPAGGLTRRQLFPAGGLASPAASLVKLTTSPLKLTTSLAKSAVSYVTPVLSLVMLSAFLLTLTACGGQPSAARKGRIIALTDEMLGAGGTDTVRFGHMRSGEIAVLRLWLENRASTPLVIVSCDRSCGCTTLEYDAQPITPGGAQQVTLTFDSRGERGWQLKTLDLRLSGASRPLRLFVEADVE
ncbi:DUF1573 domain-containing protein [Alistipes sp.]|uniref:DUF1573 domain-containing protein n=1 Tax=Alistipes sp. TaxID=1872444 RepID=UPI003AEF9E51